MIKFLLIILLLGIMVLYFSTLSIKKGPSSIIIEVLETLIPYENDVRKGYGTDLLSIYDNERLRRIENLFTHDGYMHLKDKLSSFTLTELYNRMDCSCRVRKVECDVREYPSSTVVLYTLDIELIFDDNGKYRVNCSVDGVAHLMVHGDQYMVESIDIYNDKLRSQDRKKTLL